MIKRRQLAEFNDRCFTVVPAVFSTPEVREMLAAFDRLEALARQLGESCTYRGSEFVIEPNGNGRAAIQRIVWCGAAEPTLSDYGRDPRLLKMAGLLLGAWEMRQLINQAHFKLPGDGVAFPWQQDGSHVQAVVALDEIPERQAGTSDASRAEALTMKPGAVALFGPHGLHRGRADDSDRPRRVFINGFAHPDANRPVHPGRDAGRLVRITRNGA